LHKILPFIKPAVQAVETGLASANQPGATKQSIVLTVLTGAESVADAGLSQEDQHVATAVKQAVAAAITGTVTDLKASGTLAQTEGVTDTMIQAVSAVTAAIAPPAAAVADATGTAVA
jgi:hypothetical protein